MLVPVTVKVYVPGVVGLPVIAPVDGLSVSPAGTDGAADHDVAGDPDTKANERDSETPAVAEMLVVGAIAGATTVVVMARLTDAELA